MTDKLTPDEQAEAIEILTEMLGMTWEMKDDLRGIHGTLGRIDGRELDRRENILQLLRKIDETMLTKNNLKNID